MDINTILAIAELHKNPAIKIQFDNKKFDWEDSNLSIEEIMHCANKGTRYRIKPKIMVFAHRELPMPTGFKTLHQPHDATLDMHFRFKTSEDMYTWMNYFVLSLRD